MLRYLPIVFGIMVAALLVAVFPANGRNMIIAQNGIAPAIHTRADKLAIDGHDPVAYFTEDRPVVGKPEHSVMWSNVEWRFASAEHRALFLAAPEKYAPQFGGYCAWATSQGYIAPGDPDNWHIVEGKLYLNFNDQAQTLWEADIPGNIGKGDANWPRVLSDNQNTR